jgi:hypothetical protein
MSGWIKMHRKITENPLYFSEPFNRTMAWIDLLLLANHTDNFFFKRGIRVDVKIGEVGYDLDTLSKRWKWSRGKIERFLKMLENDNQIVRQKTNVTTLISIVNYDLYQSDNKASSKASDKASGRKQEGKELKEVFKAPTFEEVLQYCNERKNNIDVNKFINFYSSKGWMIGKNKMKDWKAAIRTWEASKEKSEKVTDPLYEKAKALGYVKD